MRATAHGSRYAYGSLPVRHKHPARRIARLVLVLGLEAAAAFALVAAITGSSPPPADAGEAAPPLAADEVAAKPASFRSGEVSVAGRIRPRPERVSKRDRYAFVLEGAREGRLLVVPADDAKLPAYRAGITVIVRGTVVIPPDSARLARRVASRTAVAERAGAAAILKAVAIEVAP